MLLQQRAREVVDWRSYQEEQQKLVEEQSAIELKRKLHLEEYQQKREEQSHLSWRQQKALQYQTNKQLMREREKTQSKELSLVVIIKGIYPLPPLDPAHYDISTECALTRR